MTLGSKEGLANLAQAITAPGDTMLSPNPSYPIHPFGFIIAGATIRHVPFGPGIELMRELHGRPRLPCRRPHGGLQLSRPTRRR